MKALIRITVFLLTFFGYLLAGQKASYAITRSHGNLKTNAHITKCWKCNGSGDCSNCKGVGKVDCRACGGTGEKPYYGYGTNPHEKCTPCKGSGRVVCSTCNSSGKCNLCHGTGVLSYNNR